MRHQGIHNVASGLTVAAMGVGALLTLWGLVAEWGLAGLIVGFIALPLSYLAVPLISVAKYGAVLLIITNYLIPGVLFALAKFTDPKR